MIEGFQNAGKIPELRRRIFFTLAMLAVYRVGVHIPTPGIDRVALASFFDRVKDTIFGLFNLFSGGALEQFSVFSLGIMPYISASIILQLLTVVFPYLERLSKEGEAGRRKITQYTRLRHDRSFHRAGLDDRRRHGGYPRRRRGADRARSGLGIPHYDDHHAHFGHRVHHVAGRADHRARYRQTEFRSLFSPASSRACPPR
jgi:preprotein translocase subunit SecY